MVQRIGVAIVTIAALVVVREPVHAGADLRAVPQITRAPAVVYVKGQVGDSVYVLTIDYGDGTSQSWDGGGVTIPPFDVFLPHEYNCPGERTLKAEYFDGLTWVKFEWALSIGYPSALPLTSSVTGHVAGVFTNDLGKAQRADRSIVDWGDGSALEDFHWQPTSAELILYMTPSHAYAAPGDYLVTVTNQYLSPPCSLSQGSAIEVTIESPNPVRPTTWGRIKALYR